MVALEITHCAYNEEPTNSFAISLLLYAVLIRYIPPTPQILVLLGRVSNILTFSSRTHRRVLKPVMLIFTLFSRVSICSNISVASLNLVSSYARTYHTFCS